MVKLNRIYTRTGDDGTTGLVDGSRVAKDDARLAAMGDVDEANSAIGVAIVALGDHALAATLKHVQNDLFDLGADIATQASDFSGADGALRITARQVARLESEIDSLTAQLQLTATPRRLRRSQPR